jgi:hypothetical protein
MPTTAAPATTHAQNVIGQTWRMFAIELPAEAMLRPEMAEYEQLIYLIINIRAQIASKIAYLNYYLQTNSHVALVTAETDKAFVITGELNQKLTFHTAQARNLLNKLLQGGDHADEICAALNAVAPDKQDSHIQALPYLATASIQRGFRGHIISFRVGGGVQFDWNDGLWAVTRRR